MQPGALRMRPVRTWPRPMRERRGAGAPLDSNGPPPCESVGRQATVVGFATPGTTRTTNAPTPATRSNPRLTTPEVSPQSDGSASGGSRGHLDAEPAVDHTLDLDRAAPVTGHSRDEPL